MSQETFYLEPVPPFRLDLTVWTLRRRASNVIDRWDGTTYRRVLMVAGMPVEVAVIQSGTLESPKLRITTQAVSPGRDTKCDVAVALERLLGLRIDLTEFYKQASRDPELHLLAQRFYGMKPPRFASVFEAAINAIACQQVTLTLGIDLLSRLAKTYGHAIGGEACSAHAFPRPEDLARLEPGMLRKLGFSQQKSRAMAELAWSITGGHEDLEALAALSGEEAIAHLCHLRGVGRWSAEYVMLRGLGQVHVCPGGDVVVRNNLQRRVNVKNLLDDALVCQVLAYRQPYSGLIYFHRRLEQLAEKGFLNTTVQESGTSSAMDSIDEASCESFPASDAPNWTHMASGNPQRKKDK